MAKRKNPKYEKIPIHSKADQRKMRTTRKRGQVLEQANKRLEALLSGIKGGKLISATEIEAAFKRLEKPKQKDLKNVFVFETRLREEIKTLKAAVKETQRAKRQEIKLHGIKGVVKTQPLTKTGLRLQRTIELDQQILERLQKAKKQKNESRQQG